MIPASVHAHAHGGGPDSVLWIFALPFAVAIGGYIAATALEGRRGHAWPWMRSYFWVLGCTIALIGLLGPLVTAALTGFFGHMVAHLLASTVAPVLLVLGSPITLALRTLDVVPVRRLSWMLRSGAARLLMNPVVTAALYLGSMWALYFTPLYDLAQVPFFHVLLTALFLVVGYLFTASIVSIDSNRWSIPARAIVLVVVLVVHGVFARLLYAHPLPGVSRGEAELGAQLMFYAGVLVGLALTVLLGVQWHRARGRVVTARAPQISRRSASSSEML